MFPTSASAPEVLPTASDSTPLVSGPETPLVSGPETSLVSGIDFNGEGWPACSQAGQQFPTNTLLGWYSLQQTHCLNPKAQGMGEEREGEPGEADSEPQLCRGRTEDDEEAGVTRSEAVVAPGVFEIVVLWQDADEPEPDEPEPDELEP